MNSSKLVSLGVLAGVLNAISLAWPFSALFAYGQALWSVQFVAMVAIAYLVWQSSCVRAAFIVGFSFQFSTLVISLSWLETSMSQYGGLPVPLAWVAVSLLAVFLSLFGAGAAALWKFIADRARWAGVLLFAALWLAAELARGQWFTGFGWASVAYAHIHGPFSYLAPWIGGYGITAVVAGTAALLAAQIAAPQKVVMPVGMLFLPLTLWGAAILMPDSTQETGEIDVALLQGNIKQDEKFEATTGVADALDWYGAALKNSDAHVVLAPETAIPVLPQQLPPTFWTGWARNQPSQEPVRLVGIPLGDARQGYTNSVVGFSVPDNGSDWYRYDKYHLVPFGEFIPPLFRWFVALMHIPLGDFMRGALVQPPIVVRGERISPAICFEDLFSEDLAARFRDPDRSPTILANFSNLAWFGDSTAMYQHLSITRMRSLEFARPSLRVSNTGLTSIVDHDGTVSAVLPRMERGILTGTVRGRSGVTPYARWASRWGQLPLWGLAVSSIGICFLQRRRRIT